MIQFGGLAMMPFSLLVLAGGGESADAPTWIGQIGAGLAFLLVGAGLHMTQTVGLALATDLAPVETQPKVVGLMYVMLLAGMVFSALLFGWLLADFSPLRLVQVIQGAALATIALNVVALWKQEPRKPLAPAAVVPATQPSFAEAWGHFAAGDRALRRLIATGFGTMAFSMSDVLLEPYGGQILHMAVGTTTALTATLAIGGLFGFGLASRVLGRGADPFRMASYGALVGIPAYLALIASAPFDAPVLFGLGTAAVGFGAGLFGHGTLTATMNLAPKSQTGLALGAWGAVQASAAGVAVATGGIVYEAVAWFAAARGLDPATGYNAVYALEIALLFAALLAMLPLLRRAPALARANPSAGAAVS
jgi:BCD family chlorophyll transporter-like MFS transporter